MMRVSKAERARRGPRRVASPSSGAADDGPTMPSSASKRRPRVSDAEAISSSSLGEADENRPLPSRPSKRPTLIQTRASFESFAIYPKDMFNLDPSDSTHDVEEHPHYPTSSSEGEEEPSEHEYGDIHHLTDDDHLSVGSRSVDEAEEAQQVSSSHSSLEEYYDEGDDDGDRPLNLSDLEDDERYARLLQQQEFALARHRDGSYYDSELEEQLLGPSTGADELDMSYEALLELEENLGEVKKRGLDEASLRALARRVFSPQRAEGLQADAISCSICMSEYEGDQFLIKLPCDHLFHADCAAAWLRMRASCPICRKLVPDHVVL